MSMASLRAVHSAVKIEKLECNFRVLVKPRSSETHEEPTPASVLLPSVYSESAFELKKKIIEEKLRII